jgi:ubiquinol-cytochrome c reductase cytochrome b subunit
VGCIVLPVVAFVVTRRLCLSLQAADNERLAHGDETGVVVRTPEGGYIERHQPISPGRAYAIAAPRRTTVPELPSATDGAGTPAAHAGVRRLREWLARAMFAANLPQPSTDDDGSAARQSAPISRSKDG